MKQILIALFAAVIIIIAAVIIFNQKQEPEVSKDKLQIAATIFPVYDIARNIAKDEADVNLILPPGASPHFFEFSPKQLKELQRTKTVFVIGHGLDDWTHKIKDAVSETKIITVDRDIKLRKSEEGVDPHYWLDINNAKIITENIRDELIKADPENAKLYSENAKEYIENLQAAEYEIKYILSGIPNKKLITLHDAWYYFASGFDINIVGAFEPAPGKEPSPKHIIELIKLVRENNIKSIFTEPQIATEAIGPFLKDNDLKLYTLDPIGGTNERDSYIKLMKYNAETIARALK